MWVVSGTFVRFFTGNEPLCIEAGRSTFNEEPVMNGTPGNLNHCIGNAVSGPSIAFR